MLKNQIFLFLLLTSLCTAQTVRIQGKELPYKMVDGQQMISRDVLAEAFPGYPPGEGMVNLAVLIDDPNARIIRRNGLIVSVRYYDRAMAAIYGKPKARARISPSETTPAEEPGNYRDMMDEIVRLGNIERVNHGQEPLEAESILEKSATAHSEEMAKLDYFSHTSPTPGRETPHQRIRAAGSGASATGENIAVFTNHKFSTLADKVVQGWMNSPPHRKNLLSPNFTHIGIGIGRRGKTYYFTQNFGGYR